MKKGIIINEHLSRAIAMMGHTDKLVICDAGLPIPPQVQRIDLALTRGIPSFLDSLEAVLKELVVEKAILASEIKEFSPDLHDKILEILQDIPVEYCTHQKFKELTASSRAVVRTGETTPYANIILISGVDF